MNSANVFVRKCAIYTKYHIAVLSEKTIYLGFSPTLIHFLSLRNENIFSFPSLNRNFALSFLYKWETNCPAKVTKSVEVHELGT